MVTLFPLGSSDSRGNFFFEYRPLVYSNPERGL
jgi:hypothetical protein